MKLCRHCGAAHVTRPRGLCWSCFYKPGVRELYECGELSRYGNRGIEDFNGGYQVAAEPTDAKPKSEAKLRVMRERAQAGVAMFHPQDARH